MRQSMKEKKVLHPVSRSLQFDYRTALECAEMFDTMTLNGAPEYAPPRPERKQVRQPLF